MTLQELGFELTTYANFDILEYSKHDEEQTIYIEFDTKAEIYSTTIYIAGHKDTLQITPKLHQAIHLELQRLGWIR